MGGKMIDLVIRGDTVVTPQGVGAYDILISGGKIAAVARPAAFRCRRRHAGDRRDRQDRDAGRDRSARALQMASAESGRHGDRDRSARRRQQGGGAWRHDHDDRLHPRVAGQGRARCDREA